MPERPAYSVFREVMGSVSLVFESEVHLLGQSQVLRGYSSFMTPCRRAVFVLSSN